MGLQGSGIAGRLVTALASNSQPSSIETIIKALEKKKISINDAALHPLCLSRTEKLARKLHQKSRATAKPNEKEVNQVIKELEFGDAFFAVDIGSGRIEIHLKNKRVIFSEQEDPQLRLEVQEWLRGPFLQAETYFRKRGYILSKREDGKVIVTLAPQEKPIIKPVAPLAVDLSPVDILKNRKIVIDQAALKHAGIKKLSTRLLEIAKPNEEKVNREIEKLGLHKTFFAVEVWGQIRIHLVDKRLNVWPEFPHLRWRLQNLLKLRDNAPNQDLKEEHFKSFKKLIDENGYRVSGLVQAENGWEQIFITSVDFSNIHSFFVARTIYFPLEKSNSVIDLGDKIENLVLGLSAKRILFKEALNLARTHVHSHLKLSNIISIADDMRSAGIAKGEIFKAYKEAFGIAAAMPSYLPKDGALRNLRFSLRAFGLDRGEIRKLFEEKGLKLPE